MQVQASKSLKSTQMLQFHEYLNDFPSYQTINYSRIRIPSTNNLVNKQQPNDFKRNLQTSVSLTRYHVKKKPSQSRQQYQNSLTSQSNNMNKVNLQEIAQVIMVKNKKEEEYLKNEMIRNLNGTWFQNTVNENDFSSKIYNTIGVKRNKSMFKQNKERCNPQFNNFQSTGQYRPPNIFPSRKRISLSKNILVNFNEKHQKRIVKQMKKSEGQFKFQIIKAVTQKPSVKRTPSRLSSMSSKKSQNYKTLGSFNNKKILNSQALSAIKGMKMTIYE